MFSVLSENTRRRDVQKILDRLLRGLGIDTPAFSIEAVLDEAATRAQELARRESSDLPLLYSCVLIEAALRRSTSKDGTAQTIDPLRVFASVARPFPRHKSDFSPREIDFLWYRNGVLDLSRLLTPAVNAKKMIS
ncbi:hypothetical protein EBZ80_02460 [bacterium]|nr:hypothetical protein [bacterium]